MLLDAIVFTMDAQAPRAEAVAVRDGRVVAVGTTDEIGALAGRATRVVRLGGRMVLPSFIDAHIHPVNAGVELTQCDLVDEETAAAILARVGECAAAVPDGAWLVGSSWSLPAFPDAAPRREWLDSVTGDRPAYLSAADGHSAWVNSAALRLAGITRTSADPPGGRIERDRRGEPLGTLRESAMRLVGDLVPPPTLEQRAAGLRLALAELHRAGVTAFHEAAGERAQLEAYRELDRRGELTARVVVSLRARPERSAAQVDSFLAWRREFASPRLRPGVIKFFADGVIEARTAAMLAPYTDRRGWAGEHDWRPGQLDSMVARLVGEGFSIHIHAIGDRAVRVALDAIERAEAGREREARRHQLAHLELIDSTDIPRFAALDVAANFQPLWAYPDSYIRDLTWPGIGPQRSRGLYPIGAVARAGGRLAFGSDWNVSSLVPLRGIEVAVTRRAPGDSAGEALLPDQAIDLEAALRAYTLGSAWALGLDRESGTIAPGKSADLVVLDRDPRAGPTHEIAGARVLLTLFEGHPVFGRLDSLPPP